MSDPPRTTPEELLPQHIHFGAGSFGLGMVVEICHGQAGLRTVVVSRDSNKEYHRLLKAKGSYSVLLDGDSNRRMNLSPSLRYYTDQDLEQIVEMMAGPSVLLITTSVRKENLPSIAPILARAMMRRSQQTHPTRLCVMACENLSENSTELRKHVELHLLPNQRQHLLREVFFCNTLVDRVCGSISCSGGSVDVPIEAFDVTDLLYQAEC
jgi:mannitol-1-phosphate/altronate dehydrogenase